MSDEDEYTGPDAKAMKAAMDHALAVAHAVLEIELGADVVEGVTLVAARDTGQRGPDGRVMAVRATSKDWCCASCLRKAMLASMPSQADADAADAYTSRRH